MARYDKYDPYDGGYRAYLAADWDPDDVGKPFGVGHDATGRLVKGSGVSGMKGVLVLTRAHKVRDGQVDVMTDGCITDWGSTAGEPGVDFGQPGSNYYADPDDGVIVKRAVGAEVTGEYYIGHTVEGDRLEVRFNQVAVV